jgi:hypothetical protein
MTAHRLLYLYLWIAPHVLLGVLAVILVRRKLVQEFPAFFLYTVFEVFQFVILFAMVRIPAVTGHQYTVTWLVGSAVSMALRFAIVHEVFNHLFQSYPALSAFGTRLFRWATVVLIVVALALVAYTSGTPTDAFIVAISVVDRAVSLVQCGLLVLLLLLCRFLSYSWHSYAFGIALGLGFFASMELGIAVIRTHLGFAIAIDSFNLIMMATYHCCVLFWLVALLMPQRDRVSLTALPAHNLEQWNNALQRLLS